MIQGKPLQSSSFEYNQWRSRFINIVLRVSCALGFGVFLISGITSSATPIELTIFTATYLTLLFVTFSSLRFAIKAGTFVIAGYLIGLYTLIQFGPWSDTLGFFITSIVFASILFDQRIDRRIFFLNLITMIAVGIMDVLGVLTITPNQLPPAGLGDWAIYCGKYIALAVPLMWAITLLKQDFGSLAEKFSLTINSLSKEQVDLKQRVEERSSSLIKKTEQLKATSYIARQTAEVENISLLLETVVNLVTDQFGYYHTGIFLVNETGEHAVLQAASSEGGKQMIKKGHSLPLSGENIIGYVITHKVPRIALNSGADAVRFDNPDLPDTRSEIALPLIIRNRTIGVLDIQSEQPEAFTLEDIDVLQTLSDQITMSIENTRLLDETQATLKQLETVTAVQTHEAWRQRTQKQSLAFTYTPLGLRAEPFPEEDENALTVPISLRGQKIGAISILRKDNESWNRVDRELINEVIYQASLAIENIRLLENTSQRAQQERTVSELAARFSQSLDIDGLLQTAARELGQVPEVSEVSIFIGQIPEQALQRRRPKRATG